MRQPAFNRGPALRLTVVVALLLGMAALQPRTARAQVCVGLSTPGVAYTQSFNTLSNTAGSTTNNLTIANWFMNESGGGARDNEQYAVDTGGSNTGDTYSYGAAGNFDRALGGLQSGTLIPVFGVCVTNNTGATISSLNVAYTGEQWRIGNTAAARDDRLDFQYSTNATSLTAGTWADVNALDFINPVKTAGTAGALDGNGAANRSAISNSITGLSIPAGETFWLRWNDLNASNADDGLAVDDFSLTPQVSAPTPTLNISDVTLAEGDPPGATTFTFAVTLTAPAGPGGVTFDIATADGTAQDDNPTTEDGDYLPLSLTAQTIPAGSSGPYNFSVSISRDTTAEPNETFFVNVTNIVGANAGDSQGQGTITNDDLTITPIHDVQGPGTSSPIAGAAVTVEGVVIGDYQGASQLQGFFLQEEDAQVDADPATSEGVFVFCGSCAVAVAEGQRVRVSGTVAEFFSMTRLSASAVSVVDPANRLGEVSPAPIDLPVVGEINSFYEAREGMRVTFVDTLTVAEYFELFRFGQIELFAGGRPLQFTEQNPPGAAGYAAHLDALDRRRVILDDDNNTSNAPLTLPDGLQAAYHPSANGGFGVGTQGVDFFRGGDQISALTGVLHWSFGGSGSSDAWRIRPTQATPPAFTVANPRPAAPPAVGGAITAVSMNLLNYFTTIDSTASSSSGACGPAGDQDCRGADSAAELDRQRERTSIAICALDADLYAFMELENTSPSGAIDDLLAAVNARCGGANPYAFVNTGGTLGSDTIRVALIYRGGVLAPIGAPLVDLDAVHNRPPTAQTFAVVDPANPAFGQRFTAVASHFKSKGCGGTGADVDQGDGQGCFNAARTAQAGRLLTWLSGTVLPAAGDPDLLLLGDFNAYAKEDPITTLVGGGYTDLAADLLGPGSYSYLFDGQLGHLDYAFASASLLPQITGVGNWHINADEVPLFDYSDELRDTGEAFFEEKPDGSALVPPRVVFQPASPFRASDHDPVVVGLFFEADLAITKADSPDPVVGGSNLTYTITVANAGPDEAGAVEWTDALPAGMTFVSLSAPAGWSCTTPAVGAGGTASCSIASLPAGSAVFTLVVAVDGAAPAGTVLVNTATVTSASGDPNRADNSATATTTVTELVAPTVALSSTAPDPTNSSPIPVTVTFSEPVTGFTASDIAVANGTVASFAGSGASYSFAILPAGPGLVTADVAAGAAEDAAGNPSAAAAQLSRTYDPVAPEVTIEQAAGQADPTGVGPIRFTVVFDEPVTGFDAADVALAGTAGATSAAVSGSGTTYEVAVSGMAGAGTVVASISPAAAEDAAGNVSAASSSADNSVTFAPTFPVVTGIARLSADPSNAASVQFAVTFSQDVSGVDSGDFSLAGSGAAGASVGAVAGSGSSRTVTVSTGGSGTLGLSLRDDDSIIGADSSPLGGAGPRNGDFSGPAYTIDKRAPQGGGLSVADITSGGGASHRFTVIFSDNLAIDVASLGGGDIRVTGPGGFAQLAALVGVAPDSDGTPRTATYQLAAPGGSWDAADSGRYSIALLAGQVRDTAGNVAAGVALGGFEVRLAPAPTTIYLPLLGLVGTPDLVVSAVRLSPDGPSFTAGEPVAIAVTVTNRGTAKAAPFWVDLYLNPSSPPTAANQPWSGRCGLEPCYGLVWAVMGLEPGQSVTLISEPGAFATDQSRWPGWLASGTTDLYVYVDSWNSGVTHGAVAESDEANNRAELRGLRVSGPNPPLLQSDWPRRLPPRGAPKLNTHYTPAMS